MCLGGSLGTSVSPSRITDKGGMNSNIAEAESGDNSRALVVDAASIALSGVGMVHSSYMGSDPPNMVVCVS